MNERVNKLFLAGDTFIYDVLLGESIALGKTGFT